MCIRDSQKIFLEPGQSEIVKFKIAPEMLRYYNYDLQLVAEPGAVSYTHLDVYKRQYTVFCPNFKKHRSTIRW